MCIWPSLPKSSSSWLMVLEGKNLCKLCPPPCLGPCSPLWPTRSYRRAVRSSTLTDSYELSQGPRCLKVCSMMQCGFREGLYNTSRACTENLSSKICSSKTGLSPSCGSGQQTNACTVLAFVLLAFVRTESGSWHLQRWIFLLKQCTAVMRHHCLFFFSCKNIQFHICDQISQFWNTWNTCRLGQFRNFCDVFNLWFLGRAS